MTIDMKRMSTEIEPTEMQIAQARIIAMTIRNALEELHGGGIAEPEHGLTDEQMRRINPIVRNATVTALHALENVNRGGAFFVNFQHMLLPKHWEEPEFIEEYVEMFKRHAAEIREDSVCKHCGKPIVRYEDGKWCHQDPDRSRGCRAASFDSDHRRNGSAWNEDLRRAWQAQPAKAVTAPV